MDAWQQAALENLGRSSLADIIFSIQSKQAATQSSPSPDVKYRQIFGNSNPQTLNTMVEYRFRRAICADDARLTHALPA